MSPIDCVGLKVTGLNISNRIRSDVTGWTSGEHWKHGQQTIQAKSLIFSNSVSQHLIPTFSYIPSTNSGTLTFHDGEAAGWNIPHCPPWWTLSEAANSKNCTWVKNHKKTRTYLLLILWHKIKVEMLYFVCFLGQLCSTSAQSTSPNKACEANDSLLKFTNTSLFMYHNNLVSEKEAWMFAPLTIHWKNMWMNAYWKYGRSHLSTYICLSTQIYTYI